MKTSKKEPEILFETSYLANKYEKLKFSSLITKIKNNYAMYTIERFGYNMSKIIDRRTDDVFIVMENPITIRNMILERLKDGNNR